MEGFRNKVISGFAWEASTRLIVQITSWISTIWVARILSPDDYGIVGISGIFTGLLLKVAGMGLGQALVNQREVQDYDLANVFWTSTLLAIVCYLVLFVSAPVLAELYAITELKVVIRVAGVIVVLSALSIVPQALMMREMNFRAAALIGMFSNFIVTVLTLILAFAGAGFWSLIYSTMAGELFILVTYFALIPYRPTLPARLSTAWPIYRYGASILSANLIGYANTQWATFFSGTFLGKTSAGYFQMANTLAGLPMAKIGELFSKIAFPSFSRIQNDRARTKRVFLIMHRYLFMITLPMFVGLALITGELIPILLGEKWLPIVVPVQILCILNVFRITAQIVPSILQGIGRPGANVYYQVISAPTMALSMLVGVQFGLNWMLIAWALVFPIPYIYLLNVLFKSLEISLGEFFRSIWPTIGSGAVMLAAVLGVQFGANGHKLPSMVMLGGEIAIGATAFYASYFLINRQHLVDLLGVLKRS